MAGRSWNPVLDHIRSLAARRDSPACDAELLSQFVSGHDEAAFESLLRRHGPMVLRVARRVLGNETDAEDVFQATFLLLARRAAAIRKRESVAGWLHGVAHRLALSARGKRARRRDVERRAAAARPIESPPESAWSELEETLHEVLAQLPAKYRTPLVYCYLEGRTQEEVARQLGKPLGTVRSWLARGRELLRKRLLRRGITLSAEGASAALLASVCATAEAVPVSLRIATLKAAHLFVMGENAMMLISPPVAELVRKGLTAMLVAKLKSGAVCLLMATLLIAGSGWAAHHHFVTEPAEQPQARADDAPPKQAASEERPRTDAHGDPLPPRAVARLGTVRFRHEGWINQFALSPDGRTLAAVAGKSVAFWDISTGRLTRRLTSIWNMKCLAFAPDGKSVVVGGEDCLVRLFDLASGKESRCFVGHQAGEDRFFRGVLGTFFTPDGRTLITWGSDKTVRFWDAASGKALRQLDGKDWIVQLLSPSGKLLAVKKEGSAKILRLLDAATGKEVRQLTHPADTGSMVFAPDGKTLAVSCGKIGQPGRITLWEVESGKELATLAGLKDAVFAFAFSPDGKLLASGGYDRTIRLWDVNSRKKLHETHRLSNPFYGLTFSRDSKTLISRGPENHVRLWDVATWRERVPDDGPEWGITAVAYSPDGKLAASASNNRIWLWETATGKVLRTFESQPGTVSAVMFSADGKSLVSGSYDGTLRLWDPRAGKEQRRISNGKGWVEQVALSPDGKTLAAWGHQASHEIRLWDAGTGEKRGTLEVSSEQPGVLASLHSLCFSSDGKTLYASSGTHLSILRWDMATGKALPAIGKHDGGLSGLAVCSDGRSVAAGTLDGSLYLWETATRQRRFISKEAGHVNSIAFSPDGRLLAVANTGNNYHWRGNEVIPVGVETREQVRLVRVADGKVIRRFTGHIGGIHCLGFSTDGRTLASGGSDTTVLLWDVTDRTVPRAKESPPLKPEKLVELWKGLRGTAEKSFGCMNALISAPKQTVPFLGEKLKPIAAVDAERFAQLLKKLDSDQFREREEATRELKKLGDAVEPAIRKAIEEKPSLETRRRLQLLLDELSGDERLRTLRAIEVLERIGDKKSRDLLQRLSQGAAGAWLTEEARASLLRLKSRNKTLSGGRQPPE